MMTILAEATATGGFDGLTIGVGAITAIGIAVAAVIKAFKAGVQRGRERTSTRIEDQPVHVETEERPQWITKQTLDEHIGRLETAIEDIKTSLEGERGIARTANGNVHKRIDALSERLGDQLSKLEGTSQSVKETVDKLLMIALGKMKS